MAPKLKNRSLRLEEVQAAAAKDAAKGALQHWYERCHYRANVIIPKMQIDSNLKEVATIPGWLEQKGLRNGYVMLINFISGTKKPMIVLLDFEYHRSGGLTGHQLHQQTRQFLGLELKHSLRMVSYRPWYRYIQSSHPLAEHRAVQATNAQCKHVLGTTLLYWPYV